MSHPLGPHFSSVKSRQKKIVLHPARSSYLLSVRLSADVTDDLPSDWREGVSHSTAFSDRLPDNSFSEKKKRQPDATGLCDSNLFDSGHNSPAGNYVNNNFGASLEYRAQEMEAARGRIAQHLRQQQRRPREGSDGSLPPVASLALRTAALDVVHCAVPYEASASVAIQAIFSAIGYTRRPASDFCLIETFADYQPDYNGPPLSGDGAPIRLAMHFPYHLFLTLNPFVRERDLIQFEREPRERAGIEAERASARAFFAGYGLLLGQISKMYANLLEAEMRSRSLKVALERHHYFSVMMYSILGSQGQEHLALLMEERHAWERLMFQHNAVLEHEATVARLLKERNDSLMMLFSRWREGAAEISLLRTLKGRLLTLFADHQGDFFTSAAHARNLYTESRMVGNFLGAASSGVHEEEFRVLRICCGRDRNPLLYGENPSRLQSNCINTDVFTCTRNFGKN